MVVAPLFNAAKFTLPSSKLYSILFCATFVLTVKASPATFDVLVD